MTKDFAERSNQSKRKPAKRKPAQRRTPTKGKMTFHAPSFSSGALVGAAIVLLTAYAPEILDTEASAPGSEKTTKETPKIRFEFPDLLKNNEVAANPDTYSAPPATANAAKTFRIQAASFRSEADANVLRAKLLLTDLPSSIESSKVSGETWHRVIVGPFDKKAVADRAMTRLRQQNLTAIWLN